MAPIRSVHHFGLDWNVNTVEWIAVKFDTFTQLSSNFVDPLTFHLSSIIYHQTPAKLMSYRSGSALPLFHCHQLRMIK